MKKSYLLICVAIVAIAGLLLCCRGGSSKGNINYNAHNPANLKVDAPTGVDIYVDASGSMKGYVDGIEGTFKTIVPDLTIAPSNKLSFKMPKDSIRCYTIDNKKIMSHDTEVFCDQIRNKTLFNGASSELHEMFDVVAENQIKNPGHVSVIVSDCILSFPHKDVVASPETNIQNIGILESKVTRSMTELVNNNLSVAIVQYLSDFNGKYYYTYRDVPLASAASETMKKRPFYFILIGTREKIDAMFNKKVIPDGFSSVYMFNNQSAHPEYIVIRPQKSGEVAEIKDNVARIRINNHKTAYFYVAVKDFSVASYLEPLDDIMAAPSSKGTIIDNVEIVKYNVVNEDKHIEKQEISASYFYKVTLKDNEELRDISDVTDELIFTSKSLDAKASEIVNDEVSELSELENKTFMFSHLIKAIEKAYLGEESVVARVPVTIEKVEK